MLGAGFARCWSAQTQLSSSGLALSQTVDGGHLLPQPARVIQLLLSSSITPMQCLPILKRRRAIVENAQFFIHCNVLSEMDFGIWMLGILFTRSLGALRICTVFHSVTSKNHKLNPLCQRKINKSLFSICTKDHKKHTRPPPRPYKKE